MPVTSVVRSRVLAPGAALLIPAYLAGCFHYVPANTEVSPALGTTIRATLASPTSFDLGTITVNNVTRLEGTVVEAAGDSVGLWARWLYPQGLDRYDANSVQLYVPRANIKQLEDWRLSGRQTILLAAVAAGALAGMVALVSLVTQGTDAGGGGPPPPPASVSHWWP